jgi:hypothetical protein
MNVTAVPESGVAIRGSLNDKAFYRARFEIYRKRSCCWLLGIKSIVMPNSRGASFSRRLLLLLLLVWFGCKLEQLERGVVLVG